MELRERILDAAIDAFNGKGVKFTLEDISKALNISKKTIYTVFADKESLLKALVEQGFANIKADERAILEDDGLTTLEKIRKVIIVMPENMKRTDFLQFSAVKEKYPKLFKTIQKRIESEWEPTIGLIELGIAEGKIKPVSIPILKAMIEATIEHFLESDLLKCEGIQYSEALESMMDIIMGGIQKEV